MRPETTPVILITALLVFLALLTSFLSAKKERDFTPVEKEHFTRVCSKPVSEITLEDGCVAWWRYTDDQERKKSSLTNP